MFVINWKCGYGNAYVVNMQSNRKPYTHDINDPDIKVWKTRKNAERFLSLKSPGWAAMCVIEEKP